MISRENKIDFSILFSFEGIGLLLMFLTLPVVSRIYDPVDFGDFEKYVVFVGVVGNIFLLIFEFKIYDYVTKKDQTVSLLSCLFLIGLFSFLFLSLSSLSIHYIPNKLFSSYHIIILIFLWLLFVSLANMTLSYFSSAGNFKRYSIVRLLSNIVLITCQIICGLLSFKFYGFLYAIILQNVCISIFGVIPVYNLIRTYYKDISIKDVLSQLTKNKNILMYTFPGSLLNRLTQSLPVYFLATFNPVHLGYYAFGSQLLNHPLKLFNGLGNMFKKEFNDEIRKDKIFEKSFRKYSKIFAGVSVSLLLGVFLLSDLLVPLIFGDSWNGVVPILKILVLHVSLRYVAAGLSPVLLIGNLPKYDIFFQCFYLIMAALSIYVAKQIFNTSMSVIYSYAVSSVIFYICYFILMKYFSNKTIHR